MLCPKKIDVFLRQCRKIIRNELIDIILFGPVARGNCNHHTEIDILILLNRSGLELMGDRLRSIVNECNDSEGPRITVKATCPDDLIEALKAGVSHIREIVFEGQCLMQSRSIINAKQIYIQEIPDSRRQVFKCRK